VRTFLVKISIKSSNLACCCRKFKPAGLVVLFQSEMHALMTAVLLRMARLDALNANAQPDHQTASLLKLKSAWGEARARHYRCGCWQAGALLKKPFKHGKSVVFFGARRASPVRRYRLA